MFKFVDTRDTTGLLLPIVERLAEIDVRQSRGAARTFQGREAAAGGGGWMEEGPPRVVSKASVICHIRRAGLAIHAMCTYSAGCCNTTSVPTAQKVSATTASKTTLLL